MTATRTLAAVAAAFALGLAWTGSALAYPWPVKPFNKPHPVRGNFGDPRTVFSVAPAASGLFGPGEFSFHQGVDISAPGGTPVYAVMSGTAYAPSREQVNVDVRPGLTFQYVHIDPVLYPAHQVVAGKTILGYVQKAAGHVHLTEIRDSRVVNPLLKGHLSPYYDRTRPRVTAISVRDPQGQPLGVLGIHGKIELTAEACDTPQIPAPGVWRHMPVTPAIVQWQLTAANTGKLVIPVTTAADFSAGLPGNKDFWTVYARGTYQNQPRFDNTIYSWMPGQFLFDLTPTLLDTHTLRNGPYLISVTAIDVRGHRGTLQQPFFVRN
jgi:peptidase M23-like protein